MESCTLLVLGSQYGVQIYDWDGRNIIYDLDFALNGIAEDDKQVTCLTVGMLSDCVVPDNRPHGKGCCCPGQFPRGGGSPHRGDRHVPRDL